MAASGLIARPNRDLRKRGCSGLIVSPTTRAQRLNWEKKNMAENDFPLPPPTFDFLVFSLKTQAEVRLGLLKFGEEQEDGPDLLAARHAIDLLAMIHEKTRNNLSMEEQRLIENS